MKRWLRHRLTWEGRFERRALKRYDEMRRRAREEWRNSPGSTCEHLHREPNMEARPWSTERYEFYVFERCLDCGTGISHVRRRDSAA